MILLPGSFGPRWVLSSRTPRDPAEHAAGATRNTLKMRADGLEVGPILMGMGNKAHIVTPSITARGLLNISALAGTPVGHYG